MSGPALVGALPLDRATRESRSLRAILLGRIERLELGIAEACALLPHGAMRADLEALIPGVQVLPAIEHLRSRAISPALAKRLRQIHERGELPDATGRPR